KGCPHMNSWVRADDIEEAVLRELFDLFGNAAAVQRAVQAASPDVHQLEEKRERLGRINVELKKLGQKRDRVVDAIANGVLSSAQAKAKMEELAAGEARLNEEAGRLNAALEHVLTPEEIREAAERTAEAFKRHQRVNCQEVAERAYTKDRLNYLSATSW